MIVGSEIVAHSQTEFVDERYLLDTGTVLVALYLHLDIVSDIKRDVARLALARHAVELSFVWRILNEVDRTVGIGLLIGLIIAVASLSEVRCIAEAYARGDDVAYGLNLVAEYLAARSEEAVELCRRTDRHVIVVHVVESVYRVARLFLCSLVPRAHNLVRVHAVLEVERWRHVDIVEQGEVSTDWDRVVPSVAPVLYQVRLEELVLLGVDAV